MVGGGAKALGVLVNARAGGVENDPRLIPWLSQQLTAGYLQVTASPEEVVPALHELRQLRIDTLVVVGGDGSATGTLTPLIETWPREEFPRVLLAGGGTVNTIAKSLGSKSDPRSALSRLFHGDEPNEDPRNLICVRANGDSPRYGMIFVNGAGPRFLQYYYEHSSRGPLGALQSLFASMGSMFWGGALSDEIFQPFEAEVDVDGEPVALDDFTFMAASNVRDLGLGFEPFYTAGEEPGRFHWLASNVGPRELGLRIPAIRMGIGLDAAPFEHASARRVEVNTLKPVPYTIDAELFPGVTRWVLEAGPQIRFLRF